MVLVQVRDGDNGEMRRKMRRKVGENLFVPVADVLPESSFGQFDIQPIVESSSSCDRPYNRRHKWTRRSP